MFKKVALFAFLGSASAVKCVFLFAFIYYFSLSLSEFSFFRHALTRPSSILSVGENIFLRVLTMMMI